MSSTFVEQECIREIGSAAGDIWHVLSDNGPMTLARLVREVEAPRDVVMQAIGWLAREGKVDIQTAARGRTVSLR